jgi:hypothetical protein
VWRLDPTLQDAVPHETAAGEDTYARRHRNAATANEDRPVPRETAMTRVWSGTHDMW